MTSITGQLFANEKAFGLELEKLYRKLGWLVGHTFDSRHSAAGESDYRLAHETRGEFLMAELKMPGKEPTWPQVEWLNAMTASRVECHIWYPEDWDIVVQRSQGRAGMGWSTEWYWRRGSFDLAAIRETWEREQLRKQGIKVAPRNRRAGGRTRRKN